MSEFVKMGVFRPQLKKSLAKANELLLSKSSISFSACMGNSFRQTVAGIFSNPKMSSTHMLEGHLCNTLGRVESSSSKYLIAAQDTTYYNYSGHKADERIRGHTRQYTGHYAA